MTKEEGRPRLASIGAQQSKRTGAKRSTISTRRHYPLASLSDAVVLALFVALVAAAELALCAALWVVTGP